MYAFPRSSIDLHAVASDGILYSGSSMMKKLFLYFIPVICLIKSAPRRISAIPTKYMTGPTHFEPGKKAPAKSAITGSFAPHGIKVQSIAVARRSLSFLMVRHAIIAGTPHPVPITIGITDFPESPTLLKIGSSTTVALAI